MAITYTDINELTDLAPNEISNSSKIQLNSTSCATVSSLAEKIIMIAEANDLIPIHLDLPDDIININENSSSVTISNWIKKVASNWNDFVNKINTATYIRLVDSSKASVCGVDYVNISSSALYLYFTYFNTLYVKVINYSNGSYTCNASSINLQTIPIRKFRYTTSNVINDAEPGDNFFVDISSATISIDINTALFNNSENVNNTYKFLVPAAITTINVTNNSSSPVYKTPSAKEPSDLGGTQDDFILIEITKMYKSSTVNISNLIYLVDAKLYTL